MASSIGKTLLIVAAILGILQGLLTFVGGIVAAHDSKKNDNWDPFRVRPSGKYYCGFIQFSPSNNDDFKDRGWFYRIHRIKKDGIPFGILFPGAPPPDMDAIDKLAGYDAVLSYAIICGICWIVAGVLALLAYMRNNKMLALIAGIVFAVFYLLHVALFGAIWDSVRKVNNDCSYYDVVSKDVKKRATRSATEFLAYAICAFILIFFCIIACLLFVITFKGSDEVVYSSPDAGKDAEKGGDKGKGKEGEKAKEEGKSKDAEKDVKKGAIAPTPEMKEKSGAGVSDSKKEEDKKAQDAKKLEEEKKSQEEAKKAEASKKDSSAPKEEGTKGKTEAQIIAAQFDKVNDALDDPKKIKEEAEKKFDALDTDKGGRISHDELKKCVTEITEKKGMKPPSDDKIAALLKHYDKDNSGFLSRNEFVPMFTDIFRNSREALVAKYIKVKYKEYLGKKPEGDKSGATELENLMKNTHLFYAELTKCAQQADKDKTDTLNLDEVTELCKVFCEKYKCPTWEKKEVEAVMKELDRPTNSFHSEDLRLIALTLLGISKNLVLKP